MYEEEKGYGKPPKKHQFKKGVSGNPKGRPKGKTSLLSDATEIPYPYLIESPNTMRGVLPEISGC